MGQRSDSFLKIVSNGKRPKFMDHVKDNRGTVLAIGSGDAWFLTDAGKAELERELGSR